MLLHTLYKASQREYIFSNDITYTLYSYVQVNQGTWFGNGIFVVVFSIFKHFCLCMGRHISVETQTNSIEKFSNIVYVWNSVV